MATKLNRAVPILHGLRPRDELEAMLIIQMTGVHNCALECLRRVLHPHQASEGMEANIGPGRSLDQGIFGAIGGPAKIPG